MSLAADLAKVLDGVKDPDHPWTYRVYATWEEWLTAAWPLLMTARDSYVHHDKDGNELESLEATPELVKKRLWHGDMVGTIAFIDTLNIPVKTLLHRKVDDQTIELVWRHGLSPHNSMWQQIWWDLGFRKETYLTKPQHTKNWSKYFEAAACDVAVVDENDNQRTTCTWKSRPRSKAFDLRNRQK